MAKKRYPETKILSKNFGKKDSWSFDVARKNGAFLNRWLFRQACRIDLNAWIKHKYLGRYDQMVLDAVDRR